MYKDYASGEGRGLAHEAATRVGVFCPNKLTDNSMRVLGLLFRSLLFF